MNTNTSPIVNDLHLCTSKTPTKSADLSDKGNSYHALFQSQRDIRKCEGVKQLMKNIESNVNPKTAAEGLQLLNKPDELVSSMQSGANQFTEQTGRLMTYSEMRRMYG